MFKKAVKRDAKLRLALCGPAGSGKTYSLLSIATELAGGGKIAYVDTEHGSASKYADLFEFDVIEPQKFDPRELIEAIDAAAEGGYAVFCCDSLSHYWMGKGGELELVDSAAKRIQGNSFAAWKTVTPIHNDLVDTIISAPIHVLVSMRTKTEWVVEKDDKGKSTPRKIGLAPVMRDGIEFEFDVCGDLDQDNNLTVTKSRCPQLSGAVINRPGKDMAKTLRAWLAGDPNAPAEEQAKAETRAIPELLRVPVGKLQAGEAAIVKPTFERLQDELLKTAGRDGGAVYDRITAALRDKFPKGTAIPADAMIDCWLTLYGECERLRAAKRNATQQPEPGASPTPTAAAEPAGRAEPEGPPAAIAALWGRMGDQEGIDTVLAELHADYLESLGATEGEREYDAVAKLRTLPNKMNAPETARRFVRELVERLEHLKAQAAAKRIDDSDVPEIIGGKQQGTMFEDKREVAYAHD